MSDVCPLIASMGISQAPRDPFYSFGIKAWGDLVGKGEWQLRQEGVFVNVEYLWTVSLQKPYLNRIPFPCPLLSPNHAYVMRQREKGSQRMFKGIYCIP